MNDKKIKLLFEGWRKFLSEEQTALAVLGAPAGGKSYTMNKITSVVKDPRIKQTLEKGVVLTVDKLREEFQSQDPKIQMKGFVEAFYLMKNKSKDNPEEFSKWFSDISKLWSEKFSKLIPQLKISVNQNDILFDNQPAIKSMDKLEKIDFKPVIDQLDKYNDYKRVVRYFQNLKQDTAIAKQMNVSYDEAGDEPNKIVSNMTTLHKKGYVTDVFLIHAKNVASNLIQNFYRVTTGGDGGRDSSSAIVQAYNDIEKSKNTYVTNSEKAVAVKSNELEKASDELEKANVEDDKEKGNKPIDVFVQVEPMEPEAAFKNFSEKLNPEQLKVFKAYLKYAAVGIKGLPELAKTTLLNFTKDLTNDSAYKIFEEAAKTGKFKFANGGLSPEFMNKAKAALTAGAAQQNPAIQQPVQGEKTKGLTAEQIKRFKTLIK